MEGNSNVMERNDLIGIPRAVLMQGDVAKKMQVDASEGMSLNPEEGKDLIEDKAESEADKQNKESLNADSEEGLSELLGDNDDSESSDNNAIQAQDKDLTDKKNKQEENRYNALQGMFDRYKIETQNTIDSMRQEIQDLKTEKRTLTQLLEKLNQGESLRNDDLSSTDSTGALDSDTLNKRDPNDFTDYGSDIVGLVEQNNALIDKVSALEADQEKIKTTTETIEVGEANKALNSFKADMARRVNDQWESINVDPLWINWLDDNPEYKREVNEAGRSLNALRASNVFNLFIRETGYVVDNSGKVNDDTGSREEFDLEEEVIPDVTSGSQMISTPQGKIPLVTRAEYKRACDLYAMKKIPEKEYELTKKRFHYAVQKGYIQ